VFPRQLAPTVGISDDWISLSGRDTSQKFIINHFIEGWPDFFADMSVNQSIKHVFDYRQDDDPGGSWQHALIRFADFKFRSEPTPTSRHLDKT
jgi:hypothetical protein